MDKEKIIYIIISAVIALTAGIAAIIHFLPKSSPDSPEIMISPPVSSSAAIRHASAEQIKAPLTVCTNETISVTAPAPQTDIPAESGTVNLNTAGKEELMTLKGIGEKKAIMIIEYRELHNGFSCVEELTEVKGIGEKTLEKLRADICV